MDVSKAQICPVCQGKGQVPYNFYDVSGTGSPASTAVNTFPISCRTCAGKGYIILFEHISIGSSGQTSCGPSVNLTAPIPQTITFTGFPRAS